MSQKHVRLFAPLLVALTLFAAACGSGTSTDETTTTAPAAAGGEGESSDPEPSDDSDEPADTPAADDDGDAAPASEGESPIADLLGVPLGDDDAMEEYFGQLQRDAERKISECMISQGFEYKSVDYSQFASFASDLDEDSREFAEKYGFGIASNPFEDVIQSFDDFTDPNAEYLAALSPGETEAYEMALNGAPPDGDPSDADFTFEPGGCQGEAYDEAFAFAGVFETFASEIEAAEEAFEADPRIVTARAGWAGCMAEGGYAYNEEDDALSDFERRYDTIVDEPGAYEEIDLGDIDEDSDDGPAQFFGQRNLTPDAQNRVDALAVEERAAAVASWDCNEPLREIEDDVQREYEQRFVDQHGGAIRTMLDG